MSDLLSLLGMGAGALAAHNSGVSVASNNVANANTQGYSRQRVDMEALQGTPLAGGVRAGDPQRLASSMLAGRIRVAGGALAMSRAFSEALSDAEFRLVGSGASVDQQIASLFSRMNGVASTPTDGPARDAVVAAARDLVSGIRSRAAAIDAAQREADQRVRDQVEQATSLAKQIASANKAIAISNDPVLRDQRDTAAQKLTELVGGDARIDADGQMRFVLAGGAVLVDGTRASSLQATPDATTGLARLEVVDGASRRDVTGAIGGGRIGAELAFRDVTVPNTTAQLDQLAYDVATQINAVHTAHAGLDGVSGRPMFTAPAGVAGAAKALAVDPGLAADSSRLATAAVGAGPGSNAGALAMFQLASQKVASGGTRTLTDAALGIVASLAPQNADAKADAAAGVLVADHLAGLRDSVSGVDVQEELTNLARFEHASNALTKFVSTIDDMLGTLIANL